MTKTSHKLNYFVWLELRKQNSQMGCKCADQIAVYTQVFCGSPMLWQGAMSAAVAKQRYKGTKSGVYGLEYGDKSEVFAIYIVNITV